MENLSNLLIGNEYDRSIQREIELIGILDPASEYKIASNEKQIHVVH